MAAAFGGRLRTVTDEDGDVAIFKLSDDPLIAIPGGQAVREIGMDDSVYNTPTALDNVLYVSNRTHLYAIAEGVGIASRAGTKGPE